MLLRALPKLPAISGAVEIGEIITITALIPTIIARESRTGEYWPEVVAALGPYENDRGPIFPGTARAS